MDNWIVDNWIVDTHRRAIFERRSNYCLMSRMKWKPLRSVDFGSIQIMNCLLNDDAEEVIGTRSSQVIYCLLTKFPSDHKMTIHGFGSLVEVNQAIVDWSFDSRFTFKVIKTFSY